MDCNRFKFISILKDDKSRWSHDRYQEYLVIINPDLKIRVGWLTNLTVRPRQFTWSSSVLRQAAETKNLL